MFKPSHILPTLTVEEAGEIEAREAMEREARQAKSEAKEAARRVRGFVRDRKGENK